MTTIHALNIDDVEPEVVAPGILRRELTATEQARAWLLDFEPGTEWPSVDLHDGEERYFVMSGEFIEGDQVFGPGTYVVLGKGSSHQPRSESGGRMLGINILEKQMS